MSDVVDGIRSVYHSGSTHRQELIRLKEDCWMTEETCNHSGECAMYFSEKPEYDHINDFRLSAFHTSLDEWEPLRV